MARIPADMARRPWRYLCLTAERPADDWSPECRLEHGHPGSHDWAAAADIAGGILEAHGYAFPGRVA